MKRFHCSEKLHNPETEKFCQDIAEQYRTAPDIAVAQFKQVLSSKPLTYWECVVIRERVSDLCLLYTSRCV